MALYDLDASSGYVALPVLVALESIGVPVPGETTLIVASILAARGHLDIRAVVLLAACGAIVGDNAGFWLARRLGRRVLLHPGPFLEWRKRTLRAGEVFLARHGAAAVFIGRWVAVGRVAVAWFAGAERMPWRRFAVANALGSVGWAASIGVTAYLLGSAGARWIGVAALVLAILFVIRALRRRQRRRAAGRDLCSATPPPGSGRVVRAEPRMRRHRLRRPVVRTQRCRR